MSMAEQVSIHYLDSECAALGIAVCRPDKLDDIRAHVKPKDFYDPRHQLIFEAVTELADSDKPVDPMTVISRLSDKGLIEKVGGYSYVTGLEQHVVSINNGGFHSARIREASIRRMLNYRLEKLSNTTRDTGVEMSEIRSSLAKTCDELALVTASSRAVSAEEMCKEAYENIVEGVENNKTGILSGIAKLDWLTNGWKDGNLIILAARPSVGKTAMALQLTLQALKAGVGVVFFSLEMSRGELIDRLISQETMIALDKVVRRKLHEIHLEKIGSFLDIMKGWHLYIEDGCNSDADSIFSQANTLKAQHPEIGLIVLDYLQLVDDKSERGKAENRNLELARVSRGLKKIARNLNLPVIALSQLSRGLEAQKREPRMSDLRDSGAIEQDADLIMFLHRAESPNEETKIDEVGLILAKQRSGALGRVPLMFIQKRTFFTQRADIK